MRSVILSCTRKEFANIALSPMPFPPAASDQSYAVAVLAPFAGRIPEGRLLVDGHRISLAQNEERNHLHGGRNNLSQKEWTFSQPRPEAVNFSCNAPAGLDGYPGNRVFQCQYRWDAQNRLNIQLKAESDALTCVNMSHHAYWNLSGDFLPSALEMELSIHSDMVFYAMSSFCPCMLYPLKIPPFDFRYPRVIK